MITTKKVLRERAQKVLDCNGDFTKAGLSDVFKGELLVSKLDFTIDGIKSALFLSAALAAKKAGKKVKLFVQPEVTKPTPKPVEEKEEEEIVTPDPVVTTPPPAPVDDKKVSDEDKKETKEDDKKSSFVS